MDVSKTWAGPFLPRGFHFNNLGKGPFDKAIYKISKARASLFQTGSVSLFESM